MGNIPYGQERTLLYRMWVCYIQERKIMDNDLSKCKVGDWIATLYGWKQVEEIGSLNDKYPILINNKLYTREGFFFIMHKAPSAFVEPPEWLLEYIGPKPCEFKKDELVIVTGDGNSCKALRYFAYYKNNKYHVYCGGSTSITSRRSTSAWEYCRRAIEGEDY